MLNWCKLSVGLVYIYRCEAIECCKGGIACINWPIYSCVPGGWAEKDIGVLQAMCRTREGWEFICVWTAWDWEITVNGKD